MIPGALLRLQDLAEETFEARSPGCLTRLPAIILSVGTPSGGRFRLIHREFQETVEPVDIAFATLKYVAHAPLGLFGALFPEALEIHRPDLESVGKLEEYFRETLARVDDLPVDVPSRQACRQILTDSLAFVGQGQFHRDAFTRYARSIEAPTGMTMRVAARVQLEGIERQVQKWRERIGEKDWAGLHAAVASGWARVNNSPRQQALEQAMGPEAARERLFTIQGVKTEEALLQRLAKIVNQRDLSEVFFDEKERMEEDLMGRPAREFIEARG